MTRAPSVHLVAVVGGSGAGKGWLVARLCQLLGDHAGHLQLDDFYRDRSHLPPARRAQVNFDVPHAIDWPGAVKALRACRAGKTARIPQYDFATYTRRVGTVTMPPRTVIFVDGLWLLRSPKVRQLFALTLFLDTPRALRHRRRLARDTVERGYTSRDVAQRLRTAVAPMHQRYVEPQKKHADVVLTQPYRPRQLAPVADRLWSLLHADQVDLPAREAFRTQFVSLLAQDESRN